MNGVDKVFVLLSAGNTILALHEDSWTTIMAGFE